MATFYDINSANINVVRQGKTNNFWAEWSFTSAQSKKKISVKAYKTAKKKKTLTSTYPKAVASWTIRFYYKVNKNTNTWYLDKTITGHPAGTLNTRADLWSPPEDAVAIRVNILPVSKSYRKPGKKKTYGKYFIANSTTKEMSDYDIYPSSPSISSFTITDKSLKSTISFDISNFNEEPCAVRIQIIKDEKNFVMFEDAESGKEYDYFTKDFPTPPASGLYIFTAELKEVGSYQIRAKVGNVQNGEYKWSEYSSWSSSVDTRPQAPEIKSIVAIAQDQVKIEWTAVPNITQYKIEYVNDNARYFDSNMIQSVTVENVTSYILSGMEIGHVVYFRMRSINNSDESAPSELKTIILSTKPEPPTTWSSRTNASITSDISTTDPLYLYWIHNSSDGSVQEYSKIQFKIKDTVYYLTKKNTEVNDYGEAIDKTTSIDLWSTTVYEDEGNVTSAGTIYSIFKASGTNSIKWKVCTKGAYNEYSDWSIERTIEAYEKPNLELSVTDYEGNPLVGDILERFPLNISGTVTPASQTPISFHISIISGETYETTDIYGNDMTIVEGTEVYSYFVNSDTLNHELTPKDVDFVSGISYTLIVTVYTNAGLNATATYIFSPDWIEIEEIPEAIVEYNDTYRYADITAFCRYFIGYESPEGYDAVAYCGTGISGTKETPTKYSTSGVVMAVSGDVYFNTSTYETFVCVVGGNVDTAMWIYRTTFNFSNANTWYSGIIIDGENDIYPTSGIIAAIANDYYFNTNTGDIFRCIKDGSPTEAIWEYEWNIFWQVTPNVKLSVYRKDANGKFITIAENIDNRYQSSDSIITVRDPHPSFGEYTYRIVATNTETGAVGYSDVIEENDETSVVIQWDEKWNNITDNPDEDLFEGSILELPANIKITDKNSNDVDLVSYIGRERPVAYYGTQRGEGLSINCEFPKSDEETLSLLRHLMVYRGNVYVREPSGLGYWANISISYNREYSSLTIPVTLDVKPVEGGV